MNREALCQSCLRVKSFASQTEQDASLCECGEGIENFCDCGGCSTTIEALRSGTLGRNVPGLQPHADVLSWSAEAGGIFEGGPW